MKRSPGPGLVDITRWSHIVLAEVLEPGDLAVDLTVGNGNDTFFLWQTVGREGCVVGFDIQQGAIQNAGTMLKHGGALVHLYWNGSDDVPKLPSSGIHLYCTDHAGWTRYVGGEPRAVIANLGYLPGGDHEVVTRAETTLVALQGVLDRLSPGGRLAVVCYVGHAGGKEEAQAVEKLFSGLPGDRFHVLKVSNPAVGNSPFLMVGEKRE